jgi:hypothetical protein
MKTAIIIAGHIRTWEKTRDSFLKIFSHLSPDVYVTTYDKQYGYHPHIKGLTGYHEDVILDEESVINSFKGVGVNTYVDITDSDMMDSYIAQQKVAIHPRMQNMENSLGQFLKLQHAVNSIIDIETQNNFKYDYIMKTRADALYEDNVQLSLTEKEVLIDIGNTFPNDQFMMANHDDFIGISNFMVNEFYNFTVPSSSQSPPHTMLLNAMNSQGVTITSKKILRSILRINGEQKY